MKSGKLDAKIESKLGVRGKPCFFLFTIGKEKC
jgi:hypothetical protein